MFIFILTHIERFLENRIYQIAIIFTSYQIDGWISGC